MIYEFPMLINSKVRTRFSYSRLDLRLRLRIKMKPHPRGTYLKPMDPTDAEAVEWIRDEATKYGILVWQHSGHGPHARWGWIKKAPKVPA